MASEHEGELNVYQKNVNLREMTEGGGWEAG